MGISAKGRERPRRYMNQSMFFIMSDDTRERTMQLDFSSRLGMLVSFVLGKLCWLANLPCLMSQRFLDSCIFVELCCKRKKGLSFVATGLFMNLVAGTGFEPVTFGL